MPLPPGSARAGDLLGRLITFTSAISNRCVALSDGQVERFPSVFVVELAHRKRGELS